ncbi:MAG: helix-hairpin-helix domain-containing protein [Saprospiraceae bacterium]
MASGVESFKIRSYNNAYITLRKNGEPLAEMDRAEIGKIKGVGAAIADKIGRYWIPKHHDHAG